MRHNRLTKAIPKAAARKTPVALAVNAELVRVFGRLVLFFVCFVLSEESAVAYNRIQHVNNYYVCCCC